MSDFCTSPEVRAKQEGITNNPRQYHPPLRTLKAIKSISSSDLSKSMQNVSLDENQTKTSNLTIPNQLPPSEQKQSAINKTSNAVPLTPIESRDDTIQPLPDTRNSPVSLLETPTKEIFENIKSSSMTYATSGNLKQQDYTHRLRDRLLSRGHLRKSFLS